MQFLALKGALYLNSPRDLYNPIHPVHVEHHKATSIYRWFIVIKKMSLRDKRLPLVHLLADISRHWTGWLLDFSGSSAVVFIISIPWHVTEESEEIVREIMMN